MRQLFASPLAAGLLASPAIAGTVTLTHSMSQEIQLGNSVACASGPNTTANSFYRSFDLEAFDIIGSFTVTSVDIAIEFVFGCPACEYPFDINLYLDADGDVPHLADLQHLGTASGVATSEDTPLVMNVLVSGLVPTAGTLVVEFDYPDGNSFGNPDVEANGMFPGSNNLGQTGPSYIRADACGITEITDIADVGFPEMHLVINVHGFEGDSEACPADLDGDGSVGILDLLALLAAWGTDPGGPPDFDGDGTVGILDLLTLLANWGPCL